MYICVTRPQWVNSLWPCNDIWQHRPWLTLTQVMACCLAAPSHYLNHCWLLINEFQWNLLSAILQWVPRLLFCIMSLKLILLKLLPHRPQGNALNAILTGKPLGDLVLREPTAISYLQMVTAVTIDVWRHIRFFPAMTLSIWSYLSIHMYNRINNHTTDIIWVTLGSLLCIGNLTKQDFLIINSYSLSLH